MLVRIADPHVIYSKKEKKFYCYGTKHYNNLHFAIYESSNLYDWDFVGYALDLSDGDFVCDDWFWAPECYYNENNGYYYLFYSAKLKDEYLEKYFNDKNFKEGCKICVAVSKSPRGPFINLDGNPLDFSPYDDNYLDVDAICQNVFDLDYPSKLLENSDIPKGTYVPFIDANLFIDNGHIYLFASRNCYHNCLYDDRRGKFVEESTIIGVELETDWWHQKEPVMPTIKKEYVREIDGRRKDKYLTIIDYKSNPQAWENASVEDYKRSNGERHNRRWHEGSTTFTVKINGKKKYAMTYSCNYYGNEFYGVGIAFGDNPLGPYVKYENNPIIKQREDGFVNSTGHGCVVEYEGETYYIHHARQLDGDRCLAITKFKIIDENNIVVYKTEFANSLIFDNEDDGYTF